MRLKTGVQTPTFEIKDIDGKQISSELMLGKRYMLSFYRYASCPFCNLRVSFLMGLHNELNLDNQFIGIFQSTEADMKQHVSTQQPVFSIASDYERKYYKKYGVESGVLAYILGALKISTLMKAFKKGFKMSNSMGPKTTIPADFLIDEKGIIQHVYYGKDISDHLDLESVEAFFK